MDIFRKTALEALKKSRTRTSVTVAGVALSAAMFTAVTSFGASLLNYMLEGAKVKYGGWHVDFPAVSADFAREQAGDDRVEDTASFENIGYAMLKGGKNPDKPYLFLAGFNRKTFDTLPVELLSGRLPENSGEVLVPSHVGSNGGVRISVGDVLHLSVGERLDGDRILNQHDPYLSGETGRERREEFRPLEKKGYTVVGICARPAFEERTAPGYTLITAADSMGISDDISLFVTLKNPLLARRYAKEAAGEDGYAFNQDVLRFMGISDNDVFNGYLYAVGIVLIALIMLGSVFLIYNSFTISLNDRTRQFGILLSVGATEKQLRGMVLFEGFHIGIIGIPLGICMGLPTVSLVIWLVSENFKNLMYDTVPLKLSVSLLALAASAVISMATILISAYLPARKAAGMPVMECIRQTNELKVQPRMLRTSKATGRIWGLPGILAMKNFKRNRGRYRSIVLSLTLSVVLCVSASSFGTNLRQLTRMSVIDIDGDIILYGNMTDSELAQLQNTLQTVEGVYRSAGGTDSISAISGGGKGLVFWSETPAQSTEKIKTILDALGVTGSCTLVNVHARLEDNRNILFVVNLFAVTFITMISLIATANVFNTIFTNVKLRRRELAMLRSVGMSDRDFGRMMRFECIFYGLRTLRYGLPAAGLCSWLIYWILIVGEGMDFPYQFPWKSMAVSILGVFLMIFVTMVYAVSRIRRENIIEALRDDMT